MMHISHLWALRRDSMFTIFTQSPIIPTSLRQKTSSVHWLSSIHNIGEEDDDVRTITTTSQDGWAHKKRSSTCWNRWQFESVGFAIALCLIWIANWCCQNICSSVSFPAYTIPADSPFTIWYDYIALISYVCHTHLYSYHYYCQSAKNHKITRQYIYIYGLYVSSRWNLFAGNPTKASELINTKWGLNNIHLTRAQPTSTHNTLLTRFYLCCIRHRQHFWSNHRVAGGLWVATRYIPFLYGVREFWFDTSSHILGTTIRIGNWIEWMMATKHHHRKTTTHPPPHGINKSICQQSIRRCELNWFYSVWSGMLHRTENARTQTLGKLESNKSIGETRLKIIQKHVFVSMMSFAVIGRSDFIVRRVEINRVLGNNQYLIDFRKIATTIYQCI